MRLNFDVRSSYPPAPLLQAWFLGTMPYGFLFSWHLYRNLQGQRTQQARRP